MFFPVSFVVHLYLDSCLSPRSEKNDMGGKVGNLNVNCLLYAVLIALSKCEWHAFVTTRKEECENNGLSLSVNKTKVLVFERN